MIFESILAGSCCKIYDDLNDMNMFETLNNEWLKQNKGYVNEFLKGLHFALFGLIASKYSIFALGILIMNLTPFIMNNEAYLEYEFSGYIVVLMIFCLLIAKKGIDELFSFSYIGLFVLFLLIILTPIFEILPFKNVEYGFRKFCNRLLGTIVIALCLLYNLIPNDSLPIVYYMLGYMGFSSMFQYYNVFCLKNDIVPEILYNDMKLNELDEHFSDDGNKDTDETADPNETTNDENNKD